MYTCFNEFLTRKTLHSGRYEGSCKNRASNSSEKRARGGSSNEVHCAGCARRVLCSEMQLRADIIRSAFTEASDPVWRPAPTALTASSSPSSASQPLAPHSPFIALPPPAVALGGCSPQRRCPLPPRRGRAAAAATVLAATGVNPPPPRAVRLASPLPSWSSTPAAGTAAEATAAVEETKKTKNNQRNNATRKTQSSTHISHAICGSAPTAIEFAIARAFTTNSAYSTATCACLLSSDLFFLRQFAPLPPRMIPLLYLDTDADLAESRSCSRLVRRTRVVA